MADTLHQRITDALVGVVNPRTGKDVFTTEMVRDVGTTTSGKVRLTLLLGADDDPALARDVRQALERVEGIVEARVDIADPRAFERPAPPPPRPAGRALPVVEPERPRHQHAVPAAPTPVAYPNLGRVVAVSSGKGGVGKSTVTTNLAVALARQGYRVGIMDADVYGPNVPRMMGVNAPPPVVKEKIQPLAAHGVKVMSLGFLIDKDQPAIWRGPIVMKIVTQFLRDVAWGELDVFLVDMPPGTGDAQLSLVQATHVHGAIIVTTPQEVSVGDARRGARMFERVGVPLLGIVENMSWFECPHCGKPTALFGSGGGRRLADELGLPLLGEVPLDPQAMAGGDAGTPIVVRDAASPAAKALAGIAARVAASVGVPAAR
jgi:ATP-binding protein involved in chromosome partitioning